MPRNFSARFSKKFHYLAVGFCGVEAMLVCRDKLLRMTYLRPDVLSVSERHQRRRGQRALRNNGSSLFQVG